MGDPAHTFISHKYPIARRATLSQACTYQYPQEIASSATLIVKYTFLMTPMKLRTILHYLGVSLMFRTEGD